jgi:hypothetical protein
LVACKDSEAKSEEQDRKVFEGVLEPQNQRVVAHRDWTAERLQQKQVVAPNRRFVAHRDWMGEKTQRNWKVLEPHDLQVF